MFTSHPKAGGSEGFTVMRSWGQLLMDGISALLRDPRRAYLSLFMRVQQNVYEYWALTTYLTFNFSALRTIGNKFLLFIAFAIVLGRLSSPERQADKNFLFLPQCRKGTSDAANVFISYSKAMQHREEFCLQD